MPKKILILEDEPLIAWDIEEELMSRGWDVVATTSDIAGAIASIDEKKPDIAVLDINLGRETSFSVARHCDAANIKVVFLTGESADSRPPDLRHMPICSKPVSYELLQSTLQTAASD